MTVADLDHLHITVLGKCIALFQAADFWYVRGRAESCTAKGPVYVQNALLKTWLRKRQEAEKHGITDS